MSLPSGSPLAEEWLQAALAALRKSGRAGPEQSCADVERLLTHTTDDGLAVAPLYTGPADVRPSGVRPVPWEVRQRYAGPDPVSTAAAIRNGLDNGVTAIWLALGDGLLDLDGLDEVVADVPLDRVSVALDAGDKSMAAATTWLALARRRAVSLAALRGTLGVDPLAVHARTGEPGDTSALTGLARRCAAELPGLRAVVVDATVHHDAGASDADELAASLATGVAYLRMMTGAGLSVAAALAQLEFRYAATTDQFATIAKLRAARRLWARIAAVCGASGHGVQWQHVVTSAVMMTARDPWTNILRTTVAGFAAAVAGADAITVRPFDACLGLPDDAALRLAGNTHALLREEAHLARVADPAAGSWYVESRTEALARRAWDRFIEIERAGGMAAALATGLIADRYDQTWRRRGERIARRSEPITGVTEFPDLGERRPVRVAAPPVVRSGGLPIRRAAAVFEEMRDRVDAYADRTGVRPAVFLVPLGAPAARAARQAFTVNLFAAAGITVVEPAPDDGPEAIAKAFVDSGTPVACLCGPDADYPALAGPVASALTSAGAARVWCAGKPGDHPGVHGYLHLGCDVAEALAVTLTDLGVTR